MRTSKLRKNGIISHKTAHDADVFTVSSATGYAVSAISMPARKRRRSCCAIKTPLVFIKPDRGKVQSNVYPT